MNNFWLATYRYLYVHINIYYSLLNTKWIQSKCHNFILISHSYRSQLFYLAIYFIIISFFLPSVKQQTNVWYDYVTTSFRFWTHLLLIMTPPELTRDNFFTCTRVFTVIRIGWSYWYGLTILPWCRMRPFSLIRT